MFNYSHRLGMIITLAWLLAPAVYAHKVKLFATAAGNLITGYAYFPGGGKVPNSPVKVWGPDGSSLGQTLTNTEGEFSYTVTQRVAHTFTLDTGDGHHASYTVTATELGDTPPLPSSKEPHSAPPRLPSIPSSPVAENCGQTISSPELTAQLEQVLNQQIRPLREQLEAYEANIRLHDILGGIGYILGIMGIVFYLQHRRN